MAIEVPVIDYPMFIDGASVPSSSGRWIEVRIPATHVMLELTGEPEKGWHCTIFGDKPAG